MNHMESKTFADLKLNPWLVRKCATMGVKKPTLIQEHCIPEVLNGRDCVGAAKTGSGKTLAFALPILQKLSEDPYGIFALILTPTRELSFQIADQFNIIGKMINLKLSIVVGGMDMVEQGRELSRNPHIVVATPGRLADHLDSCDTFSFKNLCFLVLDEADQLLGGNFDAQLETIFKALPKKKQSLFFSATITDALTKLKEVTGNDVFIYEAPGDVATVEQLSQHYVLCPVDARDAYLVETVRVFKTECEEGNIIIFTETCKNCQVISMTLKEIGIDNVALHSMISQMERLAALSRFRSNRVDILVATDVASRGLDIPQVQLVLNHFLPKTPKEYIHRVGRTARAGRPGKAISLVAPKDLPQLLSIEKSINFKLSEYKVNDGEVGKIFTQIYVSRSKANIKLDEDNFYERKIVNKRKQWIMEGKDPDEEVAKLQKNKKRRKKHVRPFEDNKL